MVVYCTYGMYVSLKTKNTIGKFRWFFEGGAEPTKINGCPAQN